MNQRFKNLFKFNIYFKFNILLLLFFLITKFLILENNLFFLIPIYLIFSHNEFSQDFRKPLNIYYPTKVRMISSCFLFFFFFFEDLFTQVDNFTKRVLAIRH